MSEPPAIQESKGSRLWLLALAALALSSGLWFTCHAATTAEVAAPPRESALEAATHAPAPVEPAPEFESVRRAAEQESKLKLALTPPPFLRGTIHVFDEVGKALDTAQVELTIIAHDPEQPCSSRALSPCDAEGRTQVQFTRAEAVSGFALDAEQEREHRSALAAGYRLMPAGTPPADADTCSLALHVTAPGHRSASTRFDFSIREASAATAGFSCEVRLQTPSRAPLLHLTVIDAVTRAPVAGALVKFRPVIDGGEWIHATTDSSGRAQQIQGLKIGHDGLLAKDSPDPATLPRNEGVPLVVDKPGPVVRVTVEHFPEYSPGFFWFHVDEAFIAQTDVNQTLELRPREYLALRLIDANSGRPIVGENCRANIYFYGAIPLEAVQLHGMLEQETAQKFSLAQSPIAIGLDAREASGMVIVVESERKPDNFRPSFIPHFVTADEIRASPKELTVTLKPLQDFSLFLRDLDQPDQPVITNVRVIIEGKYTSDLLAWKTSTKSQSVEFKLEETPRRFSNPAHPAFQLGAIRCSVNWGPLHPDLESVSIRRLNLIASDFTAYEILGPDMQIIAPWSETEARGVFAQPLTLVSDGEPVLGDEDGHVNFFVRRKRE